MKGLFTFFCVYIPSQCSEALSAAPRQDQRMLNRLESKYLFRERDLCSSAPINWLSVSIFSCFFIELSCLSLVVVPHGTKVIDIPMAP